MEIWVLFPNLPEYNSCWYNGHFRHNGHPPSEIVFLPGTELLPSPFRMEFSMGSLSRQYRGSLRRHRRFMQSYRQSLRHCRDPWGDQRSPVRRCRSLRDSLNIVKHCKKLLNIVKHHETLVKYCDTSWNVIKHGEPLVKYKVLKTLLNIMKHS